MYDTQLILKDAGAVTASGYGTVASVARTLSLGSGVVKGRLVVDVSAIEVASADELYGIYLLGQDADGNETSLAVLELGAAAVVQGDVCSLVGRYEVPFFTSKRGTIYETLRVRHVISGSISTGINYTARLEEY